MRLDHFALYTADLERMRAFYQTFFGAACGAPYHNPKTGLRTYFLSFEGGARLEIMSRPDRRQPDAEPARCGYVHLAIDVGGREAVDALAERLRAAGYPALSGPRVTGDGYYECCVPDPDGNLVELVAERERENT